jgi:hypothetical protein
LASPDRPVDHDRKADRRDLAFDERDRMADEREISHEMRAARADDRDRTADEREVAQDLRESREAERERRADVRSATRSRVADERDLLADERDRIADERDRVADQREIDGEMVMSARGNGRRDVSAATMAALRHRLAALALDVARVEEQLATVVERRGQWDASRRAELEARAAAARQVAADERQAARRLGGT